jgi:hypothetical protein
MPNPINDDSGWETMDLTAPPGAHDDDVGLSGFIPGWTAKGIQTIQVMPGTD